MDRATTNLQMTVVGVAALLVVGGVAWFGFGSNQPAPLVPTTQPEVTPEAIAVHVSGEVVEPGLVSVAQGSRVADVVAAAGGATARADLAAVNLASPVRDGEHVAIPAQGDPGTVTSAGARGIDLNTASASELERLPGVGPVLAGRIASFRADHGPFEEIEDLLDVPGIGEAKLASMRDAISAP